MTSFETKLVFFAAVGGALVLACGSESSSNASSSGSTPSESSYVNACTARASRCGDAGPGRPDDCSGNHRCYTQAFAADTATEVLDCLSSRPCDQSPVNGCLTPIADRIGDKAFSNKCDDRMDECNLGDDPCQQEAALFKPEVRAAFEACLQKDCSEIVSCIETALPACRF